MTREDIGRDPAVRDAIARALREDIGSGDVTTLALVPAPTVVTAEILTREPIVVAGGDVARAVFAALDARVHVEVAIADGQPAAAGATLLRLRGPARAILTGERTALNFMQRLSGIATLTRRFVEAVAGTGTIVLDTRKTTPTLRVLEKYAVRMGGGTNHRFGLHDRVLIKDNHRRLWPGREADLGGAIAAARAAYPGVPIEIEVESPAALEAALAARPDWILLDNLPAAVLPAYVAAAAGRVRLEASGGITLANVAAIAATGVDAISLGALTHSARAVDLSLEIVAVEQETAP